MFFYLALAIGLLISKRRAIWIGAALVLATMAACAPFAGQSVIARFYSRNISIEFVLGILGYYLCRATPERTAQRLRVPSLIVCLGSAILLIAVQGFLPWLPSFPGDRLVSLGLPSFLLVVSASLLSQGGWDTRIAWLVLIGDASYILYLIHPYCEYSLDRVFSAHHHWLKRDTASGMLIGVTLSVVLALMIHVYCERPAVKFLNRTFGGKRKSVEFSTPATL